MGSKSIFIKLLMYFYTIIQLPINCILVDLITYFMLEIQINYRWSLENFKVGEILRVTIFYTICNLSFPLKLSTLYYASTPLKMFRSVSIHILHLELLVRSYNPKKCKESNWQFDSQPLKPKKQGSNDLQWNMWHDVENILSKARTFQFENVL
jgi:hypothetical protein